MVWSTDINFRRLGILQLIFELKSIATLKQTNPILTNKHLSVFFTRDALLFAEDFLTN